MWQGTHMTCHDLTGMFMFIFTNYYISVDQKFVKTSSFSKFKFILFNSNLYFHKLIAYMIC